MAMQFEQAAELNRHVDATIPLSWEVRWKAIRSVLPMLACCSVLLVEQVAVRLWLNDRNFVAELPLLVACLMLPGALVTLASEVQVRISHRNKRRIRLEPKRICITSAKCNRIPWKQVAELRLEPLRHAPGLSKLTIVSAGENIRQIRRSENPFVRKLNLCRVRQSLRVAAEERGGDLIATGRRCACRRMGANSTEYDQLGHIPSDSPPVPQSRPKN